MIDLVKLTVVFVLIVYLLRRRVNLGLTMFVASLTLGIAFRLSPPAFVQAAVAASTARATLTLVLALLLIMALENIMRRTGMLTLMVESLGSVIPDRRVVMALLPAFLGLLPSVGGARFSAPMVEEACLGLDLSPERKSFINYWYRHIWEFTFPLYPPLILATQFTGLPMRELVVQQLPFTVVAICAGAPFAFRGLSAKIGPALSADPQLRGFGSLLWGLSPVLAVAVLVIALGVDVSLTLALVVAGLLVWHRYSLRRVITMAREVSLNIVVMVFAVMIFKEVLMRAGAIETLPAFLTSLGVPSVAVIFALPFIIGLATGYAQAPVAVGFPLILGLLMNQSSNPGLVSVAFAGGFAGVMLSPAHLCLALTVEHFRANIGPVLRLVLVPELLVLSVAIGVAWLN